MKIFVSQNTLTTKNLYRLLNTYFGGVEEIGKFGFGTLVYRKKMLFFKIEFHMQDELSLYMI